MAKSTIMDRIVEMNWPKRVADMKAERDKARQSAAAWKRAAKKHRAEAERLRAALQAIVDAGTWYGSALEIDLYRKGVKNGEELERMARAALGADEEGA